MTIFYLNDIRKSFYMLSLCFSIREKLKESIIIYNNFHEKFSSSYLNSLSKAFLDLNFVSLEKFLLNKNNRVKLFFYDLDYYSNSDLEKISQINFDKKILLLNNNIGVPVQENSSLKLNPDKYLIWNHEFINHMINSRNSKINLNSKKTIYYNNHLKKTPLFSNKKIDILFFLPSRLSFKNESEIRLFLIDLLRFLKQNKLQIFFKAHQRAEDNYLIPKARILLFVSKLISRLPTYILLFFSKVTSSNNIVKIFNYSIFNKIKRSNSFNNLKFPLIPIEFYLPFIKSKIVGGFSNTLIISTYLGIKSKIFGKKTIPTKFIKKGRIIDSAQYLLTNMNFFKNKKNQYEFDKNAFYSLNNIKYLNPYDLIKLLNNG